jgi:hypothetical protein
VPRQARSLLGDGLFHVTARGNAGMKIYLDEADYRTFLALMRDVAEGARMDSVRVLPDAKPFPPCRPCSWK